VRDPQQLHHHTLAMPSTRWPCRLTLGTPAASMKLHLLPTSHYWITLKRATACTGKTEPLPELTTCWRHHLQEIILLQGVLPLSCCRCTAALTTVLSHKELTNPSISPETPSHHLSSRNYFILSKLQLEYMVTQIKYWLTIPILSIPNHNISLKTNQYKMM